MQLGNTRLSFRFREPWGEGRDKRSVVNEGILFTRSHRQEERWKKTISGLFNDLFLPFGNCIAREEE